MSNFRPYRGARRGSKRKLLIALCCLLFVLLIAVVSFFITQEYLVFNADGFRFAFPWQEDKAPENDSTPPTTEQNDDAIYDIVIPPVVDEPTPPQPTTEDDYVPPEPVYNSAFLYSADALSDIASSDYDFALIVKDSDGIWAISPDGTSSTLTDDISALSSERMGIAIASPFRDAIGPRENRAAALHTQSGATWLDHEYISWYDPYSPFTEEYLKQLIYACATANFDELVLSSYQFPTRGKPNLIVYDNDDENAKVDTLTELAKKLRATADENGIALSAVLTPTASAELLDLAAGQDVAELSQHFNKLYVNTPSFDSVDLSTLKSAVEDSSCRIGLWVTGALPDEVPDGIDFIIESH